MILDAGFDPPPPPSRTTIFLSGRPPIKILDSEWEVLGVVAENESAMTVRKLRGDSETYIISGYVGSVRGGNLVALLAPVDRWESLFVEMKQVATTLGDPLLAQQCIEKFEALPFT